MCARADLGIVRRNFPDNTANRGAGAVVLLYQAIQYLADVIVQNGIADNIVAPVVHSAVDVMQEERDMIQLYAGAEHIDDENVRHLVNGIALERRILHPAALDPVLKRGAVNPRNIADTGQHNAVTGEKHAVKEVPPGDVSSRRSGQPGSRHHSIMYFKIHTATSHTAIILYCVVSIISCGLAIVKKVMRLFANHLQFPSYSLRAPLHTHRAAREVSVIKVPQARGLRYGKEKHYPEKAFPPAGQSGGTSARRRSGSMGGFGGGGGRHTPRGIASSGACGIDPRAGTPRGGGRLRCPDNRYAT